jgi:hypothetical protein
MTSSFERSIALCLNVEENLIWFHFIFFHSFLRDLIFFLQKSLCLWRFYIRGNRDENLMLALGKYQWKNEYFSSFRMTAFFIVETENSISTRKNLKKYIFNIKLNRKSTLLYQWNVRFTSWHERKWICHLIPLIVKIPTQHFPFTRI